MLVDSELKKQTDIAQWVNDHFTRPFSVDKKSHLALGCFDLAIEHHAAICALCVSGLYGSMYALLRVEFEAYGRGLWLCHVASETDVSKYEKTDKLATEFGDLLVLVENKIGLPSGPLSALKSKQWKIFCSFTHTGFQALIRRITATHTGLVNYPDKEIVSALRFAGAIALLAAVELAGIAGDQTLTDATQAKWSEYGGEKF